MNQYTEFKHLLSDIRLVFFNFFQFFPKDSTLFSKAEKLLSIFEGYFNDVKRDITDGTSTPEKKRKSSFTTPKGKKKKVSIQIKSFFEEIQSPKECLDWIDPLEFKENVNLYEYQKVFHS